MRVALSVARRMGIIAAAAGFGVSCLLAGTAGAVSQAAAGPAATAGPITVKPIANRTGVVGNPLRLAVSATDSVKGAKLKYHISGINGSFLSNNNIRVPSVSVNGSVFTGWLMLPGTFHVQVIVSDDKGNSATTQFTWTVRYDNSGPSGRIRLGSGGKCLDTSSAGVRLWACNGTRAQRWTFERDWTIRAYGKCLTEKGRAQGWPLVLTACTGSRIGQLWSPRGPGYFAFPVNPAGPNLVNLTSGRCIDDVGGARNGASVLIEDCRGKAAQKWIVPAGPVQSEIPGMCLTDPGNSTAATTKMVFARCAGSASQRWSYQSGSTLRIHGRCLALLNRGTAAGTPAVLRPCDGRPDESWAYQQVLPVGGIEGLMSGKMLGAAANTVRSGTPVRLEPFSHRTGLDWRMI